MTDKFTEVTTENKNRTQHCDGNRLIAGWGSGTQTDAPGDWMTLKGFSARRSGGGKMGEKSVQEIIEEVKNEICDNYCRYPTIYNVDEEDELNE